MSYLLVMHTNDVEGMLDKVYTRYPQVYNFIAYTDNTVQISGIPINLALIIRASVNCEVYELYDLNDPESLP